MSNQNFFDLTGKNAIITGAVGILGKGFCSGLASHGANIAVLDINQAACDEFAAELERKYSIKAKGFACDVASPQSVSEMIRRVVAAFGEVHVLHNNAATKSDKLDRFFAPFEDYSLEEWRKIMAVNIDGMFLVAQAVGKQMVAQKKGGSIIQTASIYGLMAPDHRIYEGSLYMGMKINTPAVYTVSKAAVLGLTKHLATYWAEHNIRVNALVPGGVESGQNDEFKKRYSARIPLGRMAKPNEMVGALIYLASDASSYVTGQNLVVDGGLNAW